MLKNLKSSLAQKEEAFSLLKNQYPLIAYKSDAEILSYFEPERSEIVAFSKDFKNLYEETKHHPLEQNFARENMKKRTKSYSFKDIS